MKRVLAIGAHPDDIEFGVGGTLLKHKNNGDFTLYLCMTSTESVDWNYRSGHKNSRRESKRSKMCCKNIKSRCCRIFTFY